MSGSKDRSVQFWDPRRAAEAARSVSLQGHDNSVISIAHSPANSQFATGSGDKKVGFALLHNPVERSVNSSGRADLALPASAGPDLELQHVCVNGRGCPTQRLWNRVLLWTFAE